MQPCTIIIFGATGDLAKKKLLPALYHLNIENRLTDNTRIICMGRQETTQSQSVSYTHLTLPTTPYV